MTTQTTHKFLRGTAALILALGAGACGDDDDDLPALSQGPGMFMNDFATNASFFTQMTNTQNSTPHNNTAARIYYSTNIRSLVDGTRTFNEEVPVGTVAIKALYDSQSTFTGTTTMIKREAGYDAAGNDWEYSTRDVNGANLQAGNSGGSPVGANCFNCHSAASGTDYLAGTSLAN